MHARVKALEMLGCLDQVTLGIQTREKSRTMTMGRWSSAEKAGKVVCSSVLIPVKRRQSRNGCLTKHFATTVNVPEAQTLDDRTKHIMPAGNGSRGRKSAKACNETDAPTLQVPSPIVFQQSNLHLLMQEMQPEGVGSFPMQRMMKRFEQL